MAKKKNFIWQRRFVLMLIAWAAIALLFTIGVVGSLQALLMGINSGHLDKSTIKNIKNLNAGIVRLDAFAWDVIEKEKGTFDFSATDPMVALARKNNMEILGLLQHSPSWASGTGFARPEKFASNCGLPDVASKNDYNKYRAYPPLDPSDFATFVYMTVRRYPDIKYWQIWNEPNSPIFWRGAPNAREYTALLQQAYGAAKRANPNAVVVMGGLSLNDLNYLGQMYNAGARNYFNIAAIHPYNIIQEPQDYLESELLKLNKFMKNRGDWQKPVWITEIGWPTTSGGLTEKAQAKYLEQVYLVADGLEFMGAVFWHTLSDCTTNLNRTREEHNFGLYRTDLSEKPAVQKYREVIHKKQLFY